jgi:hypothetical protein
MAGNFEVKKQTKKEKEKDLNFELIHQEFSSEKTTFKEYFKKLTFQIMYPYGYERFSEEDEPSSQAISKNKKLDKKHRYQQMNFFDTLKKKLADLNEPKQQTQVANPTPVQVATATPIQVATATQISATEKRSIFKEKTMQPPTTVEKFSSISITKKRAAEINNADNENDTKKRKIMHIKQEKVDQDIYSSKLIGFNYDNSESPFTVPDNISTEPINYKLNETQWLTSTHIDLAAEALQRDHLSTYVHTTLRIDHLTRHNCFIHHSIDRQIFFVNANGNHWYILTNIDVSKPLDNEANEQWEANPSTEWFIYDSLNCHTIENANAAKIVLQKIHPDESAVNVNFVHVPYVQQNENDCGLYAIAYASSLLNAQEPGIRVYDQSELRSQ